MLTCSLRFPVIVVMVLVFLTPSVSRAAAAQTIPAGARAPTRMPAAKEKLAAGAEEYFLDGYVRRSDVYTIPANGITLSQAIAAAGGLEEDDAMIYVDRKNEAGTYGSAVSGRWSELANTPAAELQLKHHDLIRVFSLKTMQLWPYAKASAHPQTLPVLLTTRRALLELTMAPQGKQGPALAGMLKSTEKMISEQVKLFAKPGEPVDFDELAKRVNQLMQADPELQKSMAVLSSQQREHQRLREKLDLMGSESRIMRERSEAEQTDREEIQKRLIELLSNG